MDGGVCSASSLDLLAGRGLDLVICLNPLSGAPGTPADPRDWLGALSRGANGRRLAHEARKVRRLGTEVVTIEPTAEDLEAMGRNLMSAKRRQEVIETAERTVLEQLRRPEHPGAPPRSAARRAAPGPAPHRAAVDLAADHADGTSAREAGRVKRSRT